MKPRALYASLALLVSAQAAADPVLPAFEKPEYREIAEQFLADYRRYQADPEKFFNPPVQKDCSVPDGFLDAALGLDKKKTPTPGVDTSITNAEAIVVSATCAGGVAQDGDIVYITRHTKTTNMHSTGTKSTVTYESLVHGVQQDGRPGSDRVRYMRTRAAKSPDWATHFTYTNPAGRPGKVDDYWINFMPESGGTMLGTNLPDGGSTSKTWHRDTPSMSLRFDSQHRQHGEQILHMFGRRTCYRHGEEIRTLDCNKWIKE